MLYLPVLVSLALLTKLHEVDCGSFTDSVLSIGTIMVEDLSQMVNKSVKSVRRIASCPFGECCNSEYIIADFTGI